MMAIESLFTPRLINEWTWPRYIQLKNLAPGLELLLERRGVVSGRHGRYHPDGDLLGPAGMPVPR